MTPDVPPRPSRSRLHSDPPRPRSRAAARQAQTAGVRLRPHRGDPAAHGRRANCVMLKRVAVDSRGEIDLKIGSQ